MDTILPHKFRLNLTFSLCVYILLFLTIRNFKTPNIMPVPCCWTRDYDKEVNHLSFPLQYSSIFSASNLHSKTIIQTHSVELI